MKLKCNYSHSSNTCVKNKFNKNKNEIFECRCRAKSLDENHDVARSHLRNRDGNMIFVKQGWGVIQTNQ